METDINWGKSQAGYARMEVVMFGWNSCWKGWKGVEEYLLYKYVGLCLDLAPW